VPAKNPLVSVVVGVYNGGDYLRESMESVLGQEGIDFECIVIDDGSTDGTGEVLDELAQAHPRLRVVHQANQGQTRALIQGCRKAKGTYIARHDADDISRPGRLARQSELLSADPELSMVSCWGLGIGPADEVLFEIRRPEDSATATGKLLARGEGPPGHGSVMFRAETYRAVGGYREEFRYAQDWDLWLRLIERGRIGYVPDFLYAFRIEERSVSGLRRDQQLRLLEVARRCHAARLQGTPETPHLEEAARISALPVPAGPVSALGNAYFIGKCLLDRRDARAVPYLRRSVRVDPWKWRHWAALVRAMLLCRRPAPPPTATPHAPVPESSDSYST
jgi:glycosyltransferase involved in cell wall biosynthesis